MAIDKIPSNPKMDRGLKACEDLLAASKASITRMPEDIFVKAYLPLFMGEKELIGDVSFDLWGRIAGGDTKPVQVYNRETGENLFVVPPLYDTSFISTTVGGNFLPGLLEKANSYSEMHPQMGQNLVENVLMSRAQKIINTTGAIEHLRTWNKILTRYGHKPLKEIPGDKKSTVGDSADDLLIFDDE